MPSLEDLRQHASEDVLALNADIFAGREAVAPKRKNKYNARKTNFEGETFDSSKEARRYHELRVLQMGDEIANLQRQVKYELQPAFVDAAGKHVKAVTYTADFVYQRGDITVIEDCKSSITAKSEAFRVRWRMLERKFANDPKVRCEIWVS